MKDNRKEFVFVIGKSEGMNREDMLAGFNALVEEQKVIDDESRYTLVFFNDTAKVSADGKSLKEIKKYNKVTYAPKGGSALYDAIALALNTVGERLSEEEESERPSQVCTIILGESDNASVEYTKEAVTEMIKVQKYTYKWDFVFYGEGGETFDINKGGALNDPKAAFKAISEYMTSVR
jgi:hypothetical protein